MSDHTLAGPVAAGDLELIYLPTPASDATALITTGLVLDIADSAVMT